MSGNITENEMEKIDHLLGVIKRTMPVGPPAILVAFGLRIIVRSLDEVATICLSAQQKQQTQNRLDKERGA